MSEVPVFNPVARLEASLAAIKGEGAHLNAVVALDEDGARAAALDSAARLAAGQPLSPLDGKTVVIKANCAVNGLPWNAALLPLADDVATEDSTVVARFRAAGAIIVGIANMHEAALGATTDNLVYGKAFNPLGDGLTPGGSSGGSAAAVAAGLVDLAVGTDTMGSVRIPSAYCGVVGFKPTRSRVVTDGVIPLSPTLDCVGFHGCSVADMAAMLAVCAADGVARSASPGIAKWLDLGVPLDPSVANCVAPIQQAQVWPSITWTGPALDKVRRAGLLVCETELLEALGHRFGDFSALTPELAALLNWAKVQSLDKATSAWALLDQAAEMVDSLFQHADFLILPTASHVAFAHDAPVPSGQADFTVLASVAGLPAITLPVGAEQEGLPAGIQIWAKRDHDESLLAFAVGLESQLA